MHHTIPFSDDPLGNDCLLAVIRCWRRALRAGARVSWADRSYLLRCEAVAAWRGLPLPEV